MIKRKIHGSRKVKENNRKAQKGKEERLHRTQAELKSKIIKLDSREETDVPITKKML